MKSLFPKESSVRRLLAFFLAARCVLGLAAQSPFESVNPFIGTTAYGTCNPGAVCPHGLMSAVPYNVVGVEENPSGVPPPTTTATPTSRAIPT